MKIALFGNPNTGKSSVFNMLTGLRQQVGNFAGVTVDKKFGNFKDVIKARYDGGFISKVDLNQVTVNQKDAEITLQALLRARGQLENALSTVLGSTSKSITRGLTLQQQVFPSKFPTGVPVDLLQRRPSIIILERKLKAQLAIIGATEALRYPNFTLSLDLGAQITNPSLLFSRLAGNLVGPIFNKGRIDNSIQLEEEKYNQLILEYEQSYLIELAEEKFICRLKPNLFIKLIYQNTDCMKIVFEGFFKKKEIFEIMKSVAGASFARDLKLSQILE